MLVGGAGVNLRGENHLKTSLPPLLSITQKELWQIQKNRRATVKCLCSKIGVSLLRDRTSSYLPGEACNVSRPGQYIYGVYRGGYRDGDKYR